MTDYIVAGTGSRSLQTETNEVKVKVLDQIKAHLKGLVDIHGDNLVVMSGIAEGFDKALAVAAMQMGLRLHVAIPNPNYGDYYWGRNSLTGQNRLAEFNYLVDYAETKVIVCDGLYEDGEHSNFVRNRFMVDQADEFLVYNPTSRGTSHCLKFIEKAKTPWKEIK